MAIREVAQGHFLDTNGFAKHLWVLFITH